MYLYLGGDTVVATERILGIFDLDNTTRSRFTRNYLAKAEKNKRVVNVSMELPKSFVVCVQHKVETVYISQISAATLLKRMDFLSGIENYVTDKNQLVLKPRKD